MYSVDEIIEQIDQESEREDNLGDLEENEEVSQENEDENTTKVKPKAKRKLGSRPKLDAERLKGPRGLICMEKMFSDLKFKGHGHEKQDLNQIMNTLQYWCHRLFPKFTFDDSLAQLERLGTKKPVITLKKKILFDMIEDLLPNDPDIVDNVTESQQEELNEFDRLLNQEPIPTTFTTQPAVTAHIELTEDQKELIARNRQLAAERRQARFDAMKEKQEDLTLQLSQTSPTHSQSLHLTEEQKLIIQKNRLLALEKRRQLQNKFNENTLESTSNQENQTEIDDFTKENETEKMDDTTNQEKKTEKIDSTNQENETKKMNDFTNPETETENNDSTNQENETEKLNDSRNQEKETENIDSTNQNKKNEKNDFTILEKEIEMVESTLQEKEIGKIDDSRITEKISDMDVDSCQENNLES